MGAIAERVGRVIRGLAAIVSSVLPGPPSEEPSPPDVDGRRPDEADETKIKVASQQKDGRGGFR